MSSMQGIDICFCSKENLLYLFIDAFEVLITGVLILAHRGRFCASSDQLTLETELLLL
jgi:hypothetical protein